MAAQENLGDLVIWLEGGVRVEASEQMNECV